VSRSIDGTWWNGVTSVRVRGRETGAVGRAGCADQQWNLDSDGTVTGRESGLRLDVAGAGTANGTAVELWTCNGGSNQKWSRQ
jgi:hypothetical protein